MTLKEYKEKLAVILGGNAKDIVVKTRPYSNQCRVVAEITSNEFESEFYHTDGATPFAVYWKDKLVTQFKLVEFPGCCAIMISTGATVEAEFRDKGVNSLTNKLRQAIARECNYTAMICTDIMTNEPQRRVLGKNGFEDIYFLTNKRTNNKLAISIKELGELK